MMTPFALIRIHATPEEIRAAINRYCAPSTKTKQMTRGYETETKSVQMYAGRPIPPCHCGNPGKYYFGGGECESCHKKRKEYEGSQRSHVRAIMLDKRKARA